MVNHDDGSIKIVKYRGNIKFRSSIAYKIIHTMVGIIISNSQQITDDERQGPHTDSNTPPVTSYIRFPSEQLSANVTENNKTK